MGGMGIFRVGKDGMNLGSIIETAEPGAPPASWCSVPARIADGDKRVLIIGGKPVPYCLARIPQGNEVRGNLAAGGKRCPAVDGRTARSPSSWGRCW
jgi:glutathione synthase